MSTQSLHHFTREVLDRIDHCGYVYISWLVLLDEFDQPERKSELGRAIADFSGLPTPRQNFESWANANKLEIEYNVLHADEVRLCYKRKR